MVDSLILSGDSCPSIWLIQLTTHTDHGARVCVRVCGGANIIVLFVINKPRLRGGGVIQLNADNPTLALHRVLLCDGQADVCGYPVGLNSQLPVWK